MTLPLTMASVLAGGSSTNAEETAMAGDDQILDVAGAKAEIPSAPIDTQVEQVDYTRALAGTDADYIDPATGTVAGQLDTLLQKDSPLMQRASNFADVQSQQKGLLGSSMAIGAAQGAMVDRMTPIAQQDATTYADMGKMDKSFDQALGQMDKTQQQTFQQMDKEFGMTETINATQNYWNQQIAQGEYDQATKTTLLAGFSALSEQYVASMAAAGGSDSFSQQEADAITRFYNDNMTNYFNVANFGGLQFT